MTTESTAQAVSTETAPPELALDNAGGGSTTDAKFDELVRRMNDRNLLAPQPIYYTWKILLNAVMLATPIVAFFVIGDSWWQIVVAMAFAFACTQCGLIAHDAGHRQIFRTRRPSDILGYFHGNLLVGSSFGWWVIHHNRHHSNPNHLEKDPDITRRQVIFSASQRAQRTSGFNTFVIRHQSWLFFVLILSEGMRLHLAGFIAVAKGMIKRYKALDIGLLLVHIVGYTTTVFWVLPPAKAIVFILVHQMLFGLYMGMIFATNHKGLPVRGGAEEYSWLERQVLTSRNLKSNLFVDFLYGGLNYQIEHHLFPTMPRNNLRKAQPIVKEYCDERGLSYAETGVIASYRRVSEYLGEVSAEVRRNELATSST